MALSALVRSSQSETAARSRWLFLLAGIAVAALCVFLLLPGSIASKAHLALQGICAQRPSHSLHLGLDAMPLDARMTGLYIGAAVTGIWLLAAGTARNARVPPRRVVMLLLFFIIVLAADGFNALAFDLRLPHPYEPSNTLRLATGVLGGTAMGVALLHLIAVTLWARGDRTRSVVGSPVALLVPLSVSAALAALALSGLPVLYAPFAVGLLVATVGVFAVLTTVLLALVGNHGWTYRSFGEIGPLFCAGLVTALGLIGALAGVRYAMETWFGLLKLT